MKNSCFYSIILNLTEFNEFVKEFWNFAVRNFDFTFHGSNTNPIHMLEFTVYFCVNSYA